MDSGSHANVEELGVSQSRPVFSGADAARFLFTLLGTRSASWPKNTRSLSAPTNRATFSFTQENERRKTERRIFFFDVAGLGALSVFLLNVSSRNPGGFSVAPQGQTVPPSGHCVVGSPLLVSLSRFCVAVANGLGGPDPKASSDVGGKTV